MRKTTMIFIRHGQSIGNFLVKFFICSFSPVKLMENFSVFDEQHPSRMAGSLYRVGDHKYGLSASVYMAEKPEQFICSLRIQRPCRFVGQYEFRIGNDGSCHRRSLFLSP